MVCFLGSAVVLVGLFPAGRIFLRVLHFFFCFLSFISAIVGVPITFFPARPDSGLGLSSGHTVFCNFLSTLAH